MRHASFTLSESQRLRMAQAWENTQTIPSEVTTRITQRVMEQVNPEHDLKNFLLLRAQGLLDWARQQHIPPLKEPRSLGLSWLMLLMAVAFAFGVLVDKFTQTDGTLNLLSPPLLGWMLWNGLIYLVLLGGSISQLFHKRPMARWGRAGLTHLLESVLRHTSTLLHRSAPQMEYTSWRMLDSQKTLYRELARAMHAMALMFTLGIVTNILFRGLGAEWQVGWESTWIQNPSTLNELLHFLYGWVPYGEWPSLSDISAMHLTDPHFVAPDTAPWLVRLLALLGVTVVMPRLALVILNTVLLSRSTRVDIDLSPWMRLVKDCHADERWLAINASTYDVNKVLAPLRTLSPHPFTPLAFNPWTDNYDDLVRELRGSQPLFAVMIFNASDTPEKEVHGLVLEAVKTYGHPEHRAPAIALVTHDDKPIMAHKKEAWDAFGVDYGAHVLVLSPSPAALDSWRTLLDVS